MRHVRVAGLVSLIGLASLVASFKLVSAQENAPRAMPKWEYKVVGDIARVEVFNELGQQGWELCGAVGRLDGSTSPAHFVFKRPAR